MEDEIIYIKHLRTCLEVESTKYMLPSVLSGVSIHFRQFERGNSTQGTSHRDVGRPENIDSVYHTAEPGNQSFSSAFNALQSFPIVLKKEIFKMACTAQGAIAHINSPVVIAHLLPVESSHFPYSQGTMLSPTRPIPTGALFHLLVT